MRDVYKIYRITNLITKRSYIGQTKRKISVRWNHHKSKDADCGYISRSIKKHGPDNFKIEWISSALSSEFIDDVEDFFIRNEKTIAPNGYNLKFGGSHPEYSEEQKLNMSKYQKERYMKTTKEERKFNARGIIKHTENKKVKLTAINPENGGIIYFESFTQANEFGFSHSSIYRSLDPDKFGTSKGYHFFFRDEYTIEEMDDIIANNLLKLVEINKKRYEKQQNNPNMKKHIESQKVSYIGINTKTFEYKVFESLSSAIKQGYNTDAMRRGARGEKRRSKGMHFQRFTDSIEEHIKITKELYTQLSSNK